VRLSPQTPPAKCADRVRRLDFTDVAANDFLTVSQFSGQGPKLTRWRFRCAAGTYALRSG